MLKDTIAAIATANATGAVSLIRISGDEALNIASELIGKDLNKEKGYTIHYGTIRDKGEPVDEVLVSVFHAPRSFTGEDVAEICCHGGVFITRKILTLILGHGARLANRGEFTLLKDAENLSLGGKGHIPNLVQEDGAAIGLLEFSLMVPYGRCE